MSKFSLTRLPSSYCQSSSPRILRIRVHLSRPSTEILLPWKETLTYASAHSFWDEMSRINERLPPTTRSSLQRLRVMPCRACASCRFSPSRCRFPVVHYFVDVFDAKRVGRMMNQDQRGFRIELVSECIIPHQERLVVRLKIWPVESCTWWSHLHLHPPD